MSKPDRAGDENRDHLTAQEPEWLRHRTEHAGESEKKLWHAAYAHLHQQNHYMKDEGPYQAITRMKEQRLLPDLAVDNILGTARGKSRAELGPHGTKHRDFYTTQDRVLSPQEEQHQVTRLVEQELKQRQQTTSHTAHPDQPPDGRHERPAERTAPPAGGHQRMPTEGQSAPPSDGSYPPPEHGHHVPSEGRHGGHGGRHHLRHHHSSHGDSGPPPNRPVDGTIPRSSPYRQNNGDSAHFDSTPPPQDRTPDRSATDTAAADAAASSGQLGSLKSAIDRAKSTGRPLNVVQLGDSLTASGDQTRALAQELQLKTGARVSYDFHGAVGQTAAYALQHPNEFLSKINANTDLVVLSFGSNGDTNGGDYQRLAAMVRGKNPNATIVMAGPPDGNYWRSNNHLPYLDGVNAAETQSLAGIPNSAHVDVRSLGAGRPFSSVSYMRQNGLMSNDNLHLTSRGYHLLGTALADQIVGYL